MGGSDELAAREDVPTGRDLSRQILATRERLQTLLENAGQADAGSTIAEALQALSVTLEELEVTAEELRERNDELVATRAEVEHERRRFKELFDLAPEAYLVTDLNGSIRDANRQAERLFGRHRGELEGHPLAGLVVLDARADLRSLVTDITEGPVRGIDVHVLQNGKPDRPVSVTVRRSDAPGGVPELRWVLVDGAAHELARENMARQLEDAAVEVDSHRRMTAYQSTLLGSASHDLRTPLAVISGVHETLLTRGEELGRDGRRRLVESARAQSDKLTRVLQTLLEVGRLETEFGSLQRQAVPVRAAVKATVASLQLEGREVAVDIADALEASLDPDQFERIVQNLVENARTHTRGGSMIRIAAAPAAEDPTSLLLVVEDDGPGVPQHLRELVFDPFAQFDRDDRSGSGLGLAIVSMFATLHGGRAWVEPREGGGASFRVELADALPA